MHKVPRSPILLLLLYIFLMKKTELYQQFIAYFEKARPQAQTELHFVSNFQLLVAVILSAQCTDKRVNMITPALFDRYPTPQAMAQATPEEIFTLIKSVSYPNNKSKHLAAMAQMVMEKFGGEVPSTMEELMGLPGVGRKTANVMEAVAFNQSAMPVDTHVYRVSRRIGLVPLTCNTPYKVEIELVRNLPAEVVSTAHHWLILHGRYVCMARKPHCEECGLTEVCKYHRDAAKKSK